MNQRNAQAGIETLEALAQNTHTVIMNLIKENKRMKSDAKKYIKALKFYAEPDKTESIIRQWDQGKVARDCLKNKLTHIS